MGQVSDVKKSDVIGGVEAAEKELQEAIESCGCEERYDQTFDKLVKEMNASTALTNLKLIDYKMDILYDAEDDDAEANAELQRLTVLRKKIIQETELVM